MVVPFAIYIIASLTLMKLINFNRPLSVLAETVKLFDIMFQGADVNAKDKKNKTPLHCACWKGTSHDYCIVRLGYPLPFKHIAL